MVFQARKCFVKTLMSNQKPNSAVEFTHNKNSKKDTLFDKQGISESWYYSRLKKKLIIILEKKLLKLLENTEVSTVNMIA